MLQRLVLLLVGSCFFLLMGTARAANFTVNHNADTSDAAAGNGICADAIGNCTLRAAVEEANALSGDDMILFAASLLNATITLTTGVEITINGTGGALQIRGPGADKLTIDGGAGSNRLFLATNAATLTITSITMQGGGGGAGPDGAAIQVSGGTLELNGVVVRNNNAGANNGGGININGGVNHRILNSTIANNSASNGGGFYLSAGTLFLANSTISGNTITGQGGGVFIGSGGTATFRNATITNNTANSIIGGIEVSSSLLDLGNTIVAGNIAPNFPELGNFNTITSAGNNFIGNSGGDSAATIIAIAYQPTDIRDQDPQLGILQDNGGQTPTHALAMTSPAVNAGDNSRAVNPFNNATLTSDQRGFLPRVIGGTVDIGAFEFNAAPTAANVTIGGRVSTASGNAVGKTQISLTAPDGETFFALTNPFGYYRFDDVPVGQTYVLTVVSKRYSFTPQVISVTGELTALDLTAEP